MGWEKIVKQKEKLEFEELRIKNQKKLLKLQEKKLKISRFIQLGEELEKHGWNVLENDFQFISKTLCEELSRRLILSEIPSRTV